MYSIDTTSLPLKVKLEASSSNAHYYPTLTQYNNEYYHILLNELNNKNKKNSEK